MKRFLALLLCVLMLTAMLPLSVLAEEEEPVEAPAAVEEPAAEEPAQAPAPAEEPEAPAEAPAAEEAAPAEEPEEEPEAEEPEAEPEAEEPEEAPEAEEPEAPEVPAAPAEEEPDAQSEEIVITVKPLQDAAVENGAAVLSVKASVNAEGVKLTYQWQQLDASVSYANEQARRDAWEDIPGATGSKLSFTGIDEAVFAEEYEGMLFRCLVKTEDDCEISSEAKLLPDPAWEEESKSLLEDEAECTHEGVVHVEAKDPTCTATGNIEYWHCEACGKNFTKDEVTGELTLFEGTVETPAAGHDPEHVEAKKPTCTAPGNIEYWVCKNCEAKFEDEACETPIEGSVETPAAGHELEHVAYLAPTCTEPGHSEHYACKNCDAKFQDEAGEHPVEGSVILGATGHALEFVAEKDPTCIEPGNDEHWACTHAGCDAKFEDEEGEKPIEGSVVRPPLGHTWGEDHLCTVCGAPDPDHTSASGTCGDTVSWVYSDDRTLIVFGTGAMTNFSGTSAQPWYQYSTKITKICVNAGVTSVGKNAFRSFSALTSVTLADTVTYIGDEAFRGDSGLTSLIVPAAVTVVGANAFYLCTGLTKLSVPASLAYTNGMFYGCSNITEITLTGSNDMADFTETSYKYTPWYISSAKNPRVIFSEGITTVGAYAFCGRALSAFTVPGSVTAIGAHAFDSCPALASVTIPGSLCEIGESAFAGCNALTTVYYLEDDAAWSEFCGHIAAGNEKLTGANVLTLTHYEEVAATCEEAGHIEYWRCNNGKYYSTHSYEKEILSPTREIIIPALGHDIKKVAAKAPTCTEPGNTEYYKCANEGCGKCWEDAEGVTPIEDETTKFIPMSGHPEDTVEYHAAKEPTCEQDGNKEYYICTACGICYKSYTVEDGLTDPYEKPEDVIIPATGHDTADGHHDAAEETCTTDGNVEYWECGTCHKCFEDKEATKPLTEEQIVIKAHHTLVEQPALAPTCSKVGHIQYWKCSVETCGACFREEAGEKVPVAEEDTVIPMIPHELEIVVGQAPTCTQEGWETYEQCKNCEYNTKEPLPKLNHELTKHPFTDSDCTQPGNKEYWQCNECHTCFTSETCEETVEPEDTVIPPKGHTLEKVEALAETCTTDGHIEYYACSVCSACFADEAGTEPLTEEELVIKAHHTLVEYAAVDPTCTKAGNIQYWKCSVETCGACFKEEEGEKVAVTEAETVLEAKGHTLTHVAAVAETCESDGNIEYWHCSVCDGFFTAEAATEESRTTEAGVVIKAHHTLVEYAAVDPTCTEAGNIHYWKCSAEGCGAYFGEDDKGEKIAITQEDTVLAALGHKYVNGVCVHCSKPDLDNPFTGEFRAENEYILLDINDTKPLSVILDPAEFASVLHWVAEDTNVEVDEAGVVRGKEAGTGYVRAYFTSGGETYTVRFRVDVASAAHPVSDQIQSVQLMTTAVTSYVLRNDNYATLSILPVIDQNLELMSDPQPAPGVSVQSARFASPDAANYFSLRVRSDRTLEIVPNENAVNEALAGKKTLKASYTSAVIVKIAGKEFTSAAKVKLTVNKKKPSVKVSAIAFNSFEELLGEEYPLVFTGGKVIKIEKDETAAAKAKKSAVPEYMDLNAEEGTVALSATVKPAKYDAKGNLYLTLTLEGWRVPVSVKVPFTVKKTAPKITFSPKSVTLLQGNPMEIPVSYKVTPDLFGDESRFPVTLFRIEKKDGKKYKEIENYTELNCALTEGGMTLCAPYPSVDNKAQSFRVTLACGGEKYSIAVNTRTSASSMKIKVSGSGAINTKVENSPYTVTLTPRKFNIGSGETYELVKIQQYVKNDVVLDDATEFFHYEQDGRRFTFTEAEFGTVPEGYTYEAIFGIDIDGDGKSDVLVSSKLKISFPKTAPKIKVSAKATGTIDLARPDTAITLKTTVSNWYLDKDEELLFYRKQGKTTSLIEEQLPFDVEDNEDGTYTLRSNEFTETGVTYSVQFRAEIDGKEYPSSTVKLKVKKGAVAVKSSVTTGTMYKKDRYSRLTFRLSVADPRVAPISGIELDDASAKKFQLVELEDNTWALEYKDNTLPTGASAFKASSVKLFVYVDSCSVSVATVSIRVSYQ